MTDSKLSWAPLMRKFETLVFATMLILIPFFAYRVVDSAGTALTVQNAAADLVKDLLKAKNMARDFHIAVSVTSAPANADEHCSYIIQGNANEQVFLPRGLSIAGSVTFNENGLPFAPASFILVKGSKSASIEINREGLTSVQ